MKLSRAGLLIILAVCLVPSAGFDQGAGPEEAMKAAVLRSDEARVAATVVTNTPRLEAQLTDDCLYAHSNGRIQTKKEFIAALARGELHYDVLRLLSAPTVRLYGLETAIVTGRAHLEATTKAGGAVNLDIIYTAVYVIIDAQWKLASYHSTVAPK